MNPGMCLVVFLSLVFASSTMARAQGPIRVEVVRSDSGWQLLRGGEPYFIKGTGGG